jgi:hypothetical protein
MNSTQSLLAIVIGIILLNSCSIEKRLHRPGYHIEWKSNHHQRSTSLNTNDTSDEQQLNSDNQKIDETAEIGNSNPTVIADSTNLYQNGAERSQKEKIQQRVKSYLSSAISTPIKSISTELKGGIEEEKVRLGTEENAIGSFVCSLITWLAIFGVGQLFAYAAIILGFISLAKIKRHPDQYSGKGLAIAGIIIATIALLIVFTSA